jgi:hypothetical protein
MSPLPPLSPPPPPRGRAPASTPGGQESELWTASAQNPWIGLTLVLLIGHGAVMNLLLYTTAVAYLNAAHLMLLVVLELFSKLRVRVDARGLGIRYGHLGWLRQRIALERIEAARAFRLDPMEHGGFGYRGSLRSSGRAALVVRAGWALELALDGGKRLAISVDDAERGAELINRLVARGTRNPKSAPGFSSVEDGPSAECPIGPGSTRPS